MGRFAATLLLLWLLALNAQNTVLFGVVWGLVALYAATGLWARVSAGALAIDRRFPARAYTGAEITVDTRIRNTGRLPILWATVSDTVPLGLRTDEAPEQALTVGRHAEVHIRTPVACCHRGYYEIGPLTLRIADPLGIAHHGREVTEHRPLIVYPRVLPLRRLDLPAPSALAVLPSRTRLFEDPARLVGVRGYHPSDALRRIHWTATARTGELLVKEYEYGMSRTTMLCLDLCRASFEPRDRNQAVEMAIVVAASIASHAVRREHLELGLRVEGHDPMHGGAQKLRVPPRADARNLMSVLEVLARVQAKGSGEMDTLLRDEGQSVPWGSTLVVITGSERPRLGASLLHLKRQGHAIAVIVVSRRTVPRLPRGIAVHRVWNNELAAVAGNGRRSQK
jgi:uncharacterized protein (DUF58 family)